MAIRNFICLDCGIGFTWDVHKGSGPKRCVPCGKSKKQKDGEVWRKENIEKVRKQARDRYDPARASEKNKKFYDENAEALREKSREYRKENPEIIKAAWKNWYEENRESVIEKALARIKANPAMNRYRRSLRRAAEKRATPSWADLDKIKEIYELAARMTAETGIPHDVDHTVPLQSKWVCGLHVHTNLRVTTSTENRSKPNRRWPDMFELTGASSWPA